MSVNIGIKFLRDGNDPQHQKMIRVKRACDEAEIEWPAAITEYFDGCTDEDAGIEVPPGNSLVESANESFEIFVERLPTNVKVIKVYMSY